MISDVWFKIKTVSQVEEFLFVVGKGALKVLVLFKRWKFAKIKTSLDSADLQRTPSHIVHYSVYIVQRTARSSWNTDYFTSGLRTRVKNLRGGHQNTLNLWRFSQFVCGFRSKIWIRLVNFFWTCILQHGECFNSFSQWTLGLQSKTRKLVRARK